MVNTRMHILYSSSGCTAEAMERAKVLEITGPAGGKEEFQVTGNTCTRKVLDKDNVVKQETTMKLGDEVSGKTLDGRDVKVGLLGLLAIYRLSHTYRLFVSGSGYLCAEMLVSV